MRGLALAGLGATSLSNHIGQGVSREVESHVFTNFGPDAEQNALAFVVARPIPVGLAKVTGDNRSIHRGHNFGQGNSVGRSSQEVPPADSPLGAHQTNSLEGEQNLLEVGLRESGAGGQVSNTDRQFEIFAKRQAQQGSTGVVATG